MTSKDKDIVLLGNLFWNVFNTSENAIILMQDYKIVNCNKMALNIFGGSLDEIVGKSPFDFSPPTQPDGISSDMKGRDFFDKISEGFFNFEWLHQGINGRLFLAHVSATSFETNGVHYAAATIRDVTKQREEELELQNYRLKLEHLVEEKTKELETSYQELQTLNEELDSSNEELYASNEELNATNEELDILNGSLVKEIKEHKRTQQERENYRIQLEALLQEKTEHLAQVSERFSEVYTNSSDAIAFLDVIDGGKTIKVFDMNPVSQHLFRKTKEQIAQGVYVNDLLPEEKIDSFLQYILPKVLAGDSVTFTDERDTGNGYWNSTIYPIKNSNGEVYRIASFSRNITAEYEKQKMATLLQSAIDSWPFEFWARDLNGYEILQNRVSRERSGNLIGTTLDDLNIPSEKREQIDKMVQKVLSGEYVSADLDFTVNDKPKYFVYKLNPINEKDTIIGYTGISIDITERKLVEMELRESEERFRQIALLSKNIVYEYNLKNGIIKWDGAIGQITGYSPEEYKNFGYNQWAEMIHPEDKEPNLALFDQCLASKTDYKTQYRYRTIDNQYRWIDEDTHIVLDSDNNPVKYLGVLRDITEQKFSDEKIRLSEEKYRLLAENIDDVIWKFDINSYRYTYVSPSIYKLTGFTVEEMLETTMDKIVMPDSLNSLEIELNEWINQYNNGVPGSNHHTFECHIRHKTKQAVWIEINSTFITDLNGNIKEIIATSRSIEERKASELILRKSEERYKMIANLSGLVIYDYDIESKNIEWAGAVTNVLGYDVKELSNMGFEERIGFIHPEDMSKFNTSSNTSRNSVQSLNWQYRYLTKNRGYIWIETHAFLFTDDENRPYRWLGIMQDITEQLRIQSIIKESEEKLRTVFNTSNDGIVIVDKDMNLLDINPSALRRSGYQFEEIAGKSIIGFLINENIPSLMQYINLIWYEKTIKNFETEIVIKNQGYFPVEISASVMHLNNQEVLLLLVRDISERKRHEKELLQSIISTEERERVNFSQELHDGLGPLLSAAKMYVEWLDEPGSKVEAKTIVPDIKKLLEESTRTVKDISFKLSPHILQNYGVIEALKAYAEKVEKTGKTNISIQSENIGRFYEVAETVVYRVVCECINNTIKHAKARNILIQIEVNNPFLVVNYSDDGIGFDMEKTLTDCKGIGLLNMQSRVKSLNGFFVIQSTPGNGTKVFIKVPINLK
jgi:PAS domain S-box-containing protein